MITCSIPDFALESAFGISVNVGAGVAIKQSITVTAGDKIICDWDFIDKNGDKELAFAVMDGTIVALDYSPSGTGMNDWTLNSSDVDTPFGDWGDFDLSHHSIYATAEYTFSSGGTKEIAFVVMNNDGGSDGEGGLVVDKVSCSP